MAFGNESLGVRELGFSFAASLHATRRSETCPGGAEQAPHRLFLRVALVGDSKVTFHPELDIHSLAHTSTHSTTHR